MFYDYHKILTYNAMFNYIIGERGVGKTYGAKKFVISDFLKNGNQFVYLRRYKTEMQEACEDFFAAINDNNEFPDVKFSIEKKKNKYIFKCLKHGEDQPQIMGYGIVLSTAVLLKSSEYTTVKNLIYDEFILEKGGYHYLSNEVNHFLGICESIFRLREFRAFLLGNAVTTSNPYFDYFDLQLPYQSDVKTFRDGTHLVNYIKNDVYRQEKKQSRFGIATADTRYSKYAIDNQFLNLNHTFISKRSPNAKFLFTLHIKDQNYGIWQDTKESKTFIDKNIDPQCPITFTIDPENHNETTRLIKARSSQHFKALINQYQQGLLYYASQSIKQEVHPYIIKYAC